MSKKNEEKKPSEDKLAKQAIAKKYQKEFNETPIIFRAGFKENKFGYATITKDHIQLFEYDKNVDDVISLAIHQMDDYENVVIDHFAIKSIFQFKGISKTFELIVKEDGKKVESFIQNNTSIETQKVHRKFRNKILGFRSNTKWKMVVASAVYLFIAVAAVSGFMDKTEEKTAGSQVSQTNNEPAKKSSALDHASKETSNKPKDTALKMDDGRNVNMEIYNKYNVKYQSYEPTDAAMSKDKAVMQHFEKMAEKYNMSVPEYISKEKEIVATNVQKEKEEKQKADEDNKKQAGSSRPTISKDEFDRIENGMTYDQVKEIIGSDGEVMSEGGDKGTEYYTVMYMWKGEGSPGANANFMFQGGKLNNKAQFGLK
ncbi:DUF3862 domain-containing protein [Bacillus thuringiensis]|uniref:DUF3862 domain-containing protein n=1 Tax=Bacillus thuringiensis HD-771 TaxID=1218175 RepID=A0A9W3P1D3_BACTU|nr:DUF3862 domain-containing protein [Bacillus thuringiensis]AFQ20054.1 hypothetical protein BTG_33623 [Bacillus thuringiensis HD-771]MEC3460754.1 DUF3862 domain-containing protein [Bacillus thuringiensis]MEC3514480.1 DUF3862 domain-containing protein [Bacillus thuringiensis]MEC3540184.1 DUF3862 domain-containing protein [Bacillus thuringiensis]